MLSLALLIGLAHATQIPTASTASTATTSVAERREDALFGDDEPPEAGIERTDGPLEERREDALFGGDDEEPREGVLDRLTETLERTDDFLDIGGTLWLQLEYQALASGKPEEFPLASPSFLDMYADVRPMDRLRAFVQARLRYDFTADENTINPFTGEPEQQLEMVLDQYWVKLDILRTIFITAGKQRIRWGVGQVWQPTDFINAQRLNPIALFDQRLGVTLLKLHLPIESLGWNFYAIANLEEANRLDRVGGAFRAELVLGPAELALSAALAKARPTRLGADLSAGVWLFDVRVGFGVAHGIDTPFFETAPDLSDGITLDDASGFSPIDRSEDWIPQLVAGLEITIPYTEQDNVTIGAEYFYNDAGVSNPDLYPVLFLTGTFSPFYVGRHYAAAFVFLPSPGTWDDTSFFLTGIGNLSDRSFLARFQYQVTFLSYLRFQAYANYHFGRNGELFYGVDIPPGDPIPDDLPDGVQIPPPVRAVAEQGLELTAPLLEVGFALVVDL